MADNTPSARTDDVERFFTSLKSMNELDTLEIRNVVRGLLSPTQRDICFTGNYFRATANVETLLSLKNAKDFQAIAMLARSLFELAVEIRLINQVDNSVEKIIVFSDVEKLRSAQKIVSFKRRDPGAKVDAAIYAEFVAKNEQRINQERVATWPGVKKVAHWSLMNMAERTEKLGAPFEEIYQVNYPQLSLYVHSGIVGIVNISKETFALLAGIAFTIALEAYMQIIEAVINEFKIYKADGKLKDKMQFAKMLPFTDGPQQADLLRQAFSL